MIRLRERQVAERRARILRAAETLIRRTRGTDFPMLRLAAAAEVSPATLYNLFATKEGLLYTLLSRTLEAFEAKAVDSESREPMEPVVGATDNAVQIFLDDPKFLRPLYRFLLGVTDPAHRPRFIRRAHAYWRAAVDAAVGQHTPVAFSADGIAAALMAHFVGVLELWVHGDIDDEAFRAQAIYGALCLVLPLTQGRQATRMRERIVSAGSRLVRSS